MSLIDKKNILPMVGSVSCIELELGCGNRKRNRQAIGIDLLDYPDVDIVGDIYEVLAAFPNQSVNAVYGYHFIEHVSDVPTLFSELARIVKPNGHVEFVAPHFSNPYFYSDPTHRSFFGLYTFCYFANESPFARRVPTYNFKPEFKIVKVNLIFKSTRPFVVRYGIKRLIGSFFNSCNYLKELYEENFCYLFPCYEVRYIIRREELDT
ncbi:MAG: methyltransferase domain-containing protein [Deltaproteobacteria bacterium]